MDTFLQERETQEKYGDLVQAMTIVSPMDKKDKINQCSRILTSQSNKKYLRRF